MSKLFPNIEEAIEAAERNATALNQPITVYYAGKWGGIGHAYALLRRLSGKGVYIAMPNEKARPYTPSELTEGKRLSRNVKAKKRRALMDEAAELCGLVKVRGAVSGAVYYE